MSECPTPDRLQGLLESSLSDPEQNAISEHIDGCAACQQLLEQLTAAPTRLLKHPVDPMASTFIARVQALAPDVGAGPPTPLKPGPPPKIPGYEIEGELGRGGMGVVYKARHRRLNRLVAVKMLSDSGLSDPDIRTRFLIEAETVAQLRHAHIVQVYEFGESAGRPYLAMEFVDGGNLHEWLSRGHRLGPFRAAELIARVADALAAAHAKGIIHRDLKPSNILLAAPDSSTGPNAPLVPKVADFGIARVGRSNLTATGEVLGTPQYMAPEQASGRAREIGTATDVYGLGAILYELLTGRPPFDGDTAIDILQQVVNSAPPTPRSRSREIPRDIETICLKCLEKSPEKRYPTADALAADLRAYLDGRTIAARPASAWERAVRTARRNPVPTIALTLIVGTIIGAFVWVNEARLAESRARTDEKGARVRAEQNEKDAEAARKVAERGRARVAFEQAISLCEAGNISRGLDELNRVHESALRAEDVELADVVGRNWAVWEAYRPREERVFDSPDATRPLTVAVFADNDRLLVTGSKSGPARVWPVKGALPDGKQNWTLASPDARRPGVVAMFPEKNSRLLVVYESGHVGDWDLQTGQAIRHDLAFDTKSPICSAGTTPVGPRVSGPLIAAGLADGTYRIWDVDLRTLFLGPNDTPVLRHFFFGPKKKQRPDQKVLDVFKSPAPVTGADFADLGNMLLTAGEKEGVILQGLSWPKTGRVFDPFPDGKLDSRVYYHHFDFGGEVFKMLVGPDRQLFLAGGATAVSLWSIHDRERPMWVHGHSDRVAALAFSSDGRLCASADRGGTVRCRDVRSGAFQAELRFASPVLSLAFLPGSSNRLLVGTQDGSSALWRLPIQAELTERYIEPTPLGAGVVIRIGSTPDQAVHSVGFDAYRRGEWAMTSQRVVFWSGDGSRRHTLKLTDDQDRLVPNGTAVSPDGKWATWIVRGRQSFSVWNLMPEKRTTRRVDAIGVRQVGFMDSASLFTVSDEPEPGTNRTQGQIGWWKLDGEGGAARQAAWPLADVNCVSPHPDGKTILVGRSPEQRTGLWDIASGKEVGPPLKHPVVVTAVAVDPGRRWAATGCQDGSVRVWPLAEGIPQQAIDRSLLHGGRVNAIAFGAGPSAGVLVTASSDGTARFWDAKTGYPLGPPLLHAEAVLSVAFDPTGEKVITGGRNGSAKIWPAPRTEMK